MSIQEAALKAGASFEKAGDQLRSAKAALPQRSGEVTVFHSRSPTVTPARPHARAAAAVAPSLAPVPMAMGLTDAPPLAPAGPAANASNSAQACAACWGCVKDCGTCCTDACVDCVTCGVEICSGCLQCAFDCLGSFS